ncbi:MAG: hypothetical protein VB106_16320 [Clostridiaceae bacterium]|nr:hypothetical protein [Clostridiaceae bacterium]
MGYGKFSLYQLDSLIITANRPEPVLGILVSCIVSGFSAVLFYFLLTALNMEHLITKSIAFTLLIWAVLEVVFIGNIEGTFIAVRPISDYYIHFLGSVAHGITQGILFKHLLFKQSTY